MPTVSTSTFEIAYDGEAVRSGSMDVHELAPALLAVGDLFHQANSILNGQSASVSTRVESDFSRGSFEIKLLIDQSLIAASQTTLIGGALVDAHTLIKLLFGTGKGLVGDALSVFALYKALRGEKPTQEISGEGGNTTVIVTGSGKRVNNADKSAAKLYAKESVRTAVARVIKPLENPGIDKFEVKKDKQVIEVIHKQESELFLKSADAEGTLDISTSRDVLLRIKKVALVSGQSWSFSEGNSSINAKIADSEFENRVVGGKEGFFSGDVLHVHLRSSQHITDSGTLKSEHVIEKVVEHIHRSEQRSLLPPAPESDRK